MQQTAGIFNQKMRAKSEFERRFGAYLDLALFLHIPLLYSLSFTNRDNFDWGDVIGLVFYGICTANAFPKSICWAKLPFSPRKYLQYPIKMYLPSSVVPSCALYVECLNISDQSRRPVLQPTCSETSDAYKSLAIPKIHSVRKGTWLCKTWNAKAVKLMEFIADYQKGITVQHDIRKITNWGIDSGSSTQAQQCTGACGVWDKAASRRTDCCRSE